MGEEAGYGRSVVLLSGGIDSAVAALIAREESARLRFLTFDYGQVNRRELRAARAVARRVDPEARHDLVRLDFTLLARRRRSALLSGGAGRSDAPYRHYVPGRNLILLAHAAAIAEAEELDAIYIGSNVQDALRPDGGGYPDSGVDFLRQAQDVLRRGLKYAADIEIRAPLLACNKFDAIRLALDQGLDLGLTWSCYGDGPAACGSCGACEARLVNFHWAGAIDPLRYRKPAEEALLAALAP